MKYLQEFLFSAEKAMQKAKGLSGGERNRLLLARLFTRPANVLVLDEPTNDLDAETLDLLEDLLVEFEGTVILVSHDREFLDNVATSVLAIGPEGIVTEHVGGWSDWKREMLAREAIERERLSRESFVAAKTASAPPPPSAKKLSYKEARELEALPARIEGLEAKQAAMSAEMAAPSFYRKPSDEIAKANRDLEQLATEITQAYSRWEKLSG
jgi:ATP-binding cassette subfamily F protein uup